MGLIEKLETFLNDLLFKLGALIAKLTPRFFKKFLRRISLLGVWLISFFKKLPRLLLETSKTLAIKLFARAKEMDLGAKWVSFVQELKGRSQKESPAKTFFLFPFRMFGKWLQGLTPVQATLLMSLTAGSILASLGIFFSGKKIADFYSETGRFPASEESLAYDRPDYYKKERRHATFSNLRLPVYFAEINEVKNVDIDFTITLSNRNTRIFVEKNDFQLRDHLILQIEPSVAAFPLEDEGKEIIKKKLLLEINDFLRQHELEGTAEEINLTYILAN
jgi:flagellar basal body-associated protein FliL